MSNDDSSSAGKPATSTGAESERLKSRPQRPEMHQPTKRRTGRKKHKVVRSRGARLAISIVRIVILGYISILVALVFMEDRLVYPGAYMDDDFTTTSESPVKTVTYDSPGKITLAGRLVERTGSGNVVLFFHGNATKAKWLDRWLMQLSDTFDATVMAAEYRGFEDDVTPSERGVLEDCFAARDFLCQRYSIQPTDIILYGRSLGGGCAVALASRGGAKALILESTFDRLYKVASDRYPFVPTQLLMRNRFDSTARLTNYTGPLIQIHGTDDTIIAFDRGRALFDSSHSKQRHFIEIEGVDHNDAMPRRVITEAAEMLDQWSSDQLPAGEPSAAAEREPGDVADALSTD
ncbi:Alpha/beta hydrolase family protein [Rubripirellula lacrimiformis]|uniref:Alpha/beta hydrolase family protein n=1 Tax=Rubripirellula lacrimiformis TaxID=1930273 RepID=A0A517NAY3_9BACT|nr:alpha/beta hydrolase [Rubripirellula lacrimiformis]QDT04295.1 Alpha/beta hydrolase family protein [Rubripirellula lacrimiformis]